MSESVTQQQAPTDFVLNEFLVYSHRHTKPIDITTSIATFEIYENIEKPYLTGNVIMRDDMRFYDGVKINGTEKCEITLSQPSLDAVPTTLEFTISYVKGTIKVSDQVEMLDLRIIETTAFNNMLNQFSRTYQGSPETIIKNICKDNIGQEVSLPEIKSAQTAIKVCVPYMNAYQACNWILSRMSTPEGLPYFLFKTIKDKPLQLKSFQEMAVTDTWNKLPYTFATSNMTTSTGNLSSEQIFNVENYGQIANEGIFDLVQNGSIGSKHSVTDIGSGQSIDFQHDLSDTYRELTNIGVIENGQEPAVATNVYEIDNRNIEQMNNVNFHRLISNNTYNNWNNIYEEFDKASLRLDNSRRVIKKLLNKSSISMTVPGLPFLLDDKNRSLGRNILFYYIANNSQAVNVGEDMLDKKRSGKYLIYGARHIFDENEQHKVNLSAVKLGISK